jgi:type III secretory pathway component EscV
MADSFLERHAEEIGAQQPAPEPAARFKISLGAAAQRVHAAAQPMRRTAAEVEGLLEDEEAEETTTKRTLVPIKFDSAAEAAGLTEEERQQAVRQLASDIPTDKEGLWNWKVEWDHVEDSIIADQLRPFVEKKIMEYLGVQEQLLVEAVEEHLKKRGSAEELVNELEGVSFFFSVLKFLQLLTCPQPLDEDAENLVKKLWRMLIFYSESEKRGLSV